MKKDFCFERRGELKKIYNELLNKQKGGGNYENKYKKYKKLYLEAISKHK